MTLTEAFEYDLWANRRWVAALELNGEEQEWAVFRHLLSAQKTWLLRVDGTMVTEPPVIENPAEDLVEINNGWMTAIYSHRHNPIISYRRYNGEAMSMTFEGIARHVANHGTYHRGEIRGLYRARDCHDFPETDLIIFAKE